MLGAWPGLPSPRLASFFGATVRWTSSIALARFVVASGGGLAGDLHEQVASGVGPGELDAGDDEWPGDREESHVVADLSVGGFTGLPCLETIGRDRAADGR